MIDEYITSKVEEMGPAAALELREPTAAEIREAGTDQPFTVFNNSEVDT